MLNNLFIGNAFLSFTGSNYIDLTTSLSSVQGNNPRSFSFMIQTISTSDMGILITGGTAPPVGYSHYFEIEFCATGQLKLVSLQGSTGPLYDSGCVGTALNDNNWHTVLVTYDGSILTLYEDSSISQYATSLTINTINNNYNYLGKSANYNFMGLLKNVIYYNYDVAPSVGNNILIYVFLNNLYIYVYYDIFYYIYIYQNICSIKQLLIYF